MVIYPILESLWKHPTLKETYVSLVLDVGTVPTLSRRGLRSAYEGLRCPGLPGPGLARLLPPQLLLLQLGKERPEPRAAPVDPLRPLVRVKHQSHQTRVYLHQNT